MCLHPQADPHVKIIGRPEDVQVAKQMILQVLDTKQKNRVTLKMDVSHSDHSYIIGKGGFKIQQVMEETGCHIHFPDSNRNSNVEKSNQVSIAGEADGVETARSKIRELLPVVYMFELPAGASTKPGDESGPALQHIQQTYSFNVAFKTLIPGRVLVIVRGCNRLLSRLRQGLLYLMEYLTGSKTIPVMGYMKTEVAAQHHSFVMGNGGSNVQMIMSKTGATITFPDATASVNNPVLAGVTVLPPAYRPAAQLNLGAMQGPQVLQTKSSVVFQGSFDSVCLAWQELLKCLPLALMFDLKEGQDVDSVLVNNLMETHNINIMVRPKIKENIKSVILRGSERDSRILFQVRKEILGLQDQMCNYDQTSTIAQAASVNHGFNNEELSVPQYVANIGSTNPGSPNGLGYDMNTVESLTALSNLIHRNPKLIGILSDLTTMIPSGSPGMTQYPPNLNHDFSNGTQGTWCNSSTNRHYRAYSNDLPPFLPPPSPNKMLSSSSSVSQDDADSGIFFTSRNKSGNNSSHPESSASSTSSLCNDDTNSLYMSDFPYKERSNADLAVLLAEYENKKIGATKAMQQEIGDGVRTPSAVWSGLGFSKSMPGFALQGKLSSRDNTEQADDCMLLQSKIPENLPDQPSASSALASNNPMDQVPSPFSLSNFWEHFPQQQLSGGAGYGSIRTLQQLFNVFELEQYLELFNHHEIDFHTFLTLTDIDLQQLNISYAARRKMLSAIAAIREPKKLDLSLRQFRAAPGAERRPLFSRHLPTTSTDGK